MRECADGMQIRNGLKALNRSGVPPEDVWPYDISKCHDEPPPEVYAAAKPIAPIRYIRIDPPHPVEAVKEVLASGFPVSFGFFVEYDQELAAATGIVDLTPGGYGGTETPADHAGLIVGYDDNDDLGRFKVRNSSGSTWGDHGNFRMSYDYVNAYGDDFWFIKNIAMQEDA